jgi:hypothetical protein
LLDARLGPGSNERPLPSEEPDLRHFDSDSYQRGYLSAWDQQIGNEFSRLCVDASGGEATGGCLGTGLTPPHLPLTLKAVAPSLWRKLGGSYLRSMPTFWPTVELWAANGRHPLDLFYTVSGASGYPQGPYRPLFVRADRWTASFAENLAVLTGKTQARATALAATDRRSYSRSRDL